MGDNDWNKRRQAAESAAVLREVMREIMGAPIDDEDDVEAKRHAEKALEGLEHAEEALREWRDREEEPVEELGEGDDDGEVCDEARELAEVCGADPRTVQKGLEAISDMADIDDG